MSYASRPNAMGHWINKHSKRFNRKIVQNARSHSPLSPKIRNMGAKPVAAEDGEVTPAKELEQLVKEVTFGLKHFSDVITKRKLEMLPGNGTIVFESIANIHKAIKPYCARSPPLTSAVKRLCAALACLIRLCDEITAASLREDRTDEEAGGSAPVEVPASLQPAHVNKVVAGVKQAVEEVATLAQQYIARPALSPRPALVSPRASTQRNSLPDIPLTPKELSLLTGEAGAEGVGGVRASHSSESVLDAPDPPPPKPPRPHRKMDLAPPLPPKRKSATDSSHLGLDRVSLQSHSSGSLDSMLNVSNDEDSRTLSDSTRHDHSFNTLPTVEILSCNCGASEGRDSLDSSGHDIHLGAGHSHTNHNRFSNESGFASMNQNAAVWSECSKLSTAHSELSTATEHSFASAFSHSSHSSHSSHHFSDSTFDSTDCLTEFKSFTQTFESRMNVMNSVTHHTVSTKLSSLNNGSEAPPALPAKTRRNIPADMQQHFHNVEIRQRPPCSLHGDVRPHTLAEHNRPPPLPLKKKHTIRPLFLYTLRPWDVACVVAGNNACLSVRSVARGSVPKRRVQRSQQTAAGSINIHRHQQVQRSLAQSFTVQHLATPPLSGSEDSVSITTSSDASPVPPEPPALPPKLSKTKQACCQW
ncbi:Guanine nucleotide-releasing factor 2 [Eumeta japonica]|uniref:Guanine nucleotide-releasing factor 2 n=1 Tax=Eumeta variegata TaxID=151549 RepID=A0A4C1TD03_EUMVA|nr:Guanine nucleotide-releasing factor 2 [Eumeta japonica]